MEAKFADVPDEVWKYVEPWLPDPPSHARGGRSRLEDRRAMAGIVYRLKTGCQWKALPREFGSGSAVHRRFQAWAEAGVFHIFFAEMVHYYDDRVGVDLKWCSLDSASVKAPKGGTTRAPIRPIAQNSAQNATS
jgi:transposase